LPGPRKARNRALPLDNPTDQYLYEAIDVIENSVPQRSDIQIYNVSFGPSDPILDDFISRLAYALDNFMCKYKMIFFVAVRNHAATPGHERIQAPNRVMDGQRDSRPSSIISANVVLGNDEVIGMNDLLLRGDAVAVTGQI
jgi:hypothetical protein